MKKVLFALNLLVAILLLLNQALIPFPYEVVLFFEHGVIRPRNSGPYIFVLLAAPLILLNWIIALAKKNVSMAHIYMLCFLSGVCLSDIHYARASLSDDIETQYEINSEWGGHGKKQ